MKAGPRGCLPRVPAGHRPSCRPVESWMEARHERMWSGLRKLQTMRSSGETKCVCGGAVLPAGPGGASGATEAGAPGSLQPGGQGINPGSTLLLTLEVRKPEGGGIHRRGPQRPALAPSSGRRAGGPGQRCLRRGGGGVPGGQNVPPQLSRAREPGLEATGRGLWRMVALQTVWGA